MQVLTSGNLCVPHGFLTRSGGMSSGPYSTLNLGFSTPDDPANVQNNRARVLRYFAAGPQDLCLLTQVHGDRVVRAQPGETANEADAHWTDTPGELLAVSWADCPPLLFFDPVSGAVAAAHCGWRGTVTRLAARVVSELVNHCTADPANLQVAVGPGICRNCYQVGPELVAAFRQAGFPAGIVRADPTADGRWLLDLAAANQLTLQAAGLPAGNISGPHHCTACNPELFYSHRRDRGVTGRHWALIRMAG